jgi:selenocysteine-specific elongation factor
VQLLDEQRASDPLADGMPAEAARRALELPEPALLDAVLRTSAAAGVTRRDGRLHHGSAALPDRVREAVEQLRRDLADDPFQAPTADDLRRLGLGERELAAAERAGALLRLAPGLVLLPDAEDEALERLAELDAPFTPSQARRALGTTRRVAVPLLERLEARGATRRSGAGHCLR